MGVDDKILQLEKQIADMERQLEGAQEEIRQKNESLEDLIKANLDFDNLLMNAEIGALYIDKDLTIRKLTPIMAKNTNLKLSDTGKSIDNVDFLDDYADFQEDVKACKKQNKTIERELLRDGTTWLLRLCPYIVLDGNTDGVLVTLFDITKRLNAVKIELQMLINNIPGVVTKMRYDNGLIVEYANDTLFNLMQLSKKEFCEKYGNHYEQIIVKKDWKRLQECIEYAIRCNEQVRAEYRVATGRHDYAWHAMQASILDERNGKAVLQCVISDITEAKHTQLELEKEREKLKAVVKMSGDMIFEYDIDGDYMTYTNSGDGLLFSKEITQNYTKNLFEIIKADDEEAGKQLADALRSGKESFHIELQRMGTDKQYHWVSVIGKTIYNKEHKPEKVLGKICNIDSQKKREKELKEKSQKDSMTGLYNHVTIKNIVNKKVSRLKQGEEAYLVICDIDNFKKMNDTNGHLFGDAVICSFADEMTRLLPDAVRGRIGGDEFIVYVDNMERQSLEEQLAKLNRAMSDRYDDEKTGLHMSCSLGAVLIDGSIRDYNTLFQWADSALYKVKCDGKGSYYIINAVTGEEPPTSSYLDSERNKENHERKETQIRSDEELVLFCVELLENVSNTAIALKMICERTCSFFDLDDMVCVEHGDTKKEILYQWSRVEKKEYTQRMHKEGVYEWAKLFDKTDEQGVILYREEQTKIIETEAAKAVMLAFSKDFLDYQGSIVFVDRQKDRDWKRERDTLVRISNQIFNHLSLLKSRERNRQEIDHRLNYDALTGLPVYNRFVAMAEEYITEHSNNNLYCVYSDFSNFQYLNEKYGYEVGNRVLREFAEELSQSYDKGVFFCRVTSDHFLGFVKADSLQEAMESYLGFTYDFTEKKNTQYEHCNIVIATGLYAVKPGDTNVASIMDNANEARKKCKEQKAITAILVYTEEIKKEVESVKEVIANMVTAYNNREFYAYLQPKISLATGKIVGAEALVRWIKPDGTIIMPFHFIEVAEKNGFITKIDFVVLERVIEYLREAIDLGEEVVPISVNFSRRHSEFEEFVPSIFKYLNKYSVPSNLLEAELTETIFMADLDSLRVKIESMRKEGIEVSVDDFGSGYSSLNLLGKVVVDTIKLDKQFLDNTLNTNQEDKALIIIKYLIKMLKQLGFKVLAEGVETVEQVEMLKKAECDLIQGYYYAKPMPIPEFRKFLKKFNQEEA